MAFFQTHAKKGTLHPEFVRFSAGGSVMEQLQQWRHFSPGHGKTDSAVEWTPEQQDRKT